MKKFLLAALVMAGTLQAQADDYPYLTFELTDGAKASVNVESLTLTIIGTTLKVGSQTFTLSNLSKMYFSMTDETSAEINAIESLKIDDVLSDDAEVYDLNGRILEKGKVSDGKLPRGVYIVKTKERTCKIVVR